MNWIRYLVYSNIHISLSGAGMVALTQILGGFELALLPVYLGFVAPLFVYTFDRVTDIEEDKLNVPDRAAFLERFGTVLLASSTALYLAGIGLAALHNGPTLLFVVLYPVIGLVYSVLRTKEILYVKNLIVGGTWGTIPLLVGAYYEHVLRPSVLVLCLFFTVAWVINTIVFDVKDIDGDRAEGVQTVPNTYGLVTTRKLVQAINLLLAGSIVLLVATGAFSPLFLAITLVNLYIGAYVHFTKEEYGFGFYGFVVDGEYVFVSVFVLALYFVVG